MSDNMAVTPGTGATIAADDVGGILYQRIKLAFGTDGNAADVNAATPLPVDQKSRAFDPTVTITRPGNVTPYTGVDVVGGPVTFVSLGPPSGTVVINGAQLEIDIAAIPSGMTTFRLHLYSATPASAYADNLAFDLPSGDRATYLGLIDLGTPVDLGSTLYVETNGINKQIKLPVSGNLYGYLVTTGAFTPAAASEVYKVTLHALAV